jgi:hypothetical protein
MSKRDNEIDLTQDDESVEIIGTLKRAKKAEKEKKEGGDDDEVEAVSIASYLRSLPDTDPRKQTNDKIDKFMNIVDTFILKQDDVSKQIRGLRDDVVRAKTEDEKIAVDKLVDRQIAYWTERAKYLQMTVGEFEDFENRYEIIDKLFGGKDPSEIEHDNNNHQLEDTYSTGSTCMRCHKECY